MKGVKYCIEGSSSHPNTDQTTKEMDNSDILDVSLSSASSTLVMKDTNQALLPSQSTASSLSFVKMTT